MSEPLRAPREVWVVYNADGPDYVASYQEAAREHVLELLDHEAGRALAPWHVEHYVIAREARREALEEAARVCEAHIAPMPEYNGHSRCYFDHGHECATEIAAAIRALCS